MFSDKVNDLIGKPYDIANYNCWHLVMELVDHAPDIDKVATMSVGLRMMNDTANWAGFKKVFTPQDGDIVVMGNHKNAYHHAGVYFNGGIIHSDKPSVSFKNLDDMKKVYKEMRFYRYDKH